MAAYAIFFVILIILLGGLFTIALNEVVNEFIGVINPYISSGEMSVQYATYWGFVIAELVALPILILIAVSSWAYTRAIARDEVSAASPGSLFNGFSAAVVGIIFSIILFIAVGVPAEMLLNSFETTTMGGDGATLYDVNSPWDMGYSDTAFWMNLLYVVLIIPAQLGIIIMFLSAVKTQDYDVIGSNEGQSGYGSTSPQYVSAEEFRYMRGLR